MADPSATSGLAGPSSVARPIAVMLAFKPQMILGEAQAVLEASKNGPGLIDHPMGMVIAHHRVEDRLLPHNLLLSFCDALLRYNEG
jgi:hypothetical protein